MKNLDPEGLKQSPIKVPDFTVGKVMEYPVEDWKNEYDSINDSKPFTIWSIFMDKDKVTTYTGITAVVCTGLLFSGILVPATALYAAVVGIGTISGTIFAYFTNKPNPFVKPPDDIDPRTKLPKKP